MFQIFSELSNSDCDIFIKKLNLAHADLRGTILTFTNLYGAKVKGARFAGAKLCRTIMPDGTIANPAC